MADELRTEVEQVKERADVKQALKQTGAAPAEEKPKAETKDKLWLGTHVPWTWWVMIGTGVTFGVGWICSLAIPGSSTPLTAKNTENRG